MNKFNIGDRVKIIQGKFKDKIGIIQYLNESYYPGQINPKYDIHLEDRINNDITLNEDMLEKVELNSFEQSLLDANTKHCNNSAIEVFNEMATVKWGFMSIKLAVFENEGKYPHFHFYKNLKPEGGIPKEYRNTGGCICITEPKYFIHGNYKDTLTAKEINGLINFLKSEHKSLKGISVWEYIITLWNDNNSDQLQISLDTQIPNYKSNMDNIIDNR